MSEPAALDADRVEVILCDADDCLFPSEEIAFLASADVTNRLLAELGIAARFAPLELRRAAEGRNFRAMALALAEAHGVPLAAAHLDRWVAVERQEVIGRLGSALRPDASVREPLVELGRRFRLAVVSSSATARLAACFTAVGLDDVFPDDVRFSAEDSLPVPASKPDPAVYVLAGERLGVTGGRAVAVEDSLAGARAAIAAGFPCVANLQFVRADERAERAAALREAGVIGIVESWSELNTMLRFDDQRTAFGPGAPSR